MFADRDLLSMQCARILAENAAEAQKRLAAFSQEQLDAAVERAADAVIARGRELAVMSWEDTDCGRWEDKLAELRFVCRCVRGALRGMRCVGPLRCDEAGNVLEIGVPRGVIAAVCPSTSPVATAVYKALLAIKSGNAIIFSLHPRAIRCMSRALDLIITAATAAGLPESTISYLDAPTREGTNELMRHPAVGLVMLTGVQGMLRDAESAAKPLICGAAGNGPAFIERTADVRQAVKDIVFSKTFDCGMAPSAEQCVVVDGVIADEVRQVFRQEGAWFMSEKEARALAGILFRTDGRPRRDMVGIEACQLALRAGFEVPADTRLLIAERQYVSDTDAYFKEMLCPVLAWYVEDDWMHACEKCIELLLFNRTGHTLVIHSRDAEVIRQFALKKPVARLLVNTPACLGGMGATTDLFPAMTLGSGVAGHGMTSDNVSPMNLVYIRRVGYGTHSADSLFHGAEDTSSAAPAASNAAGTDGSASPERLGSVLRAVIRALSDPEQN
ncbi:MAG: aldehyde dehydrogenase family protein [Desulfovibrionaceae bacterium]|nr:aldehyde dehydrogenase family protein [Desulfovibrionaceae bacterium]